MKAKMTRYVAPLGGPVGAVVRVPGSKSITNRALVCAALADGESVVDGIAPGDDTAVMLECLRRLGVVVDQRGSTVVLVGAGGVFAPGPERLDAGLAGTTSRFITALACLGTGPYTVDGAPPLRTRPMTELHDALAHLGATVRTSELGGLPVEVERGSITGGTVRLRGDVSSQFVSALMLIGPYLDGGLSIELTPPIVSGPYIAMTQRVMAAFGVGVAGDTGIAVDPQGKAIVSVPAGRYSARPYVVEPDASSASYLFGAVAACTGSVEVPGLGLGSLQGDLGFVAILGDMGCEVELSDLSTRVTRRGPLRGVDVDMRDVSDTVPTLAAVALFAETPTRIRGVGFIRRKESNRIGDLAHELRRLGARVDESDDGLVIEPSQPVPATVSTHHDHRLAMALALVGLAGKGVTVEDPDVVAKSWPEYWDVIDGLRNTDASSGYLAEPR
jgi:3-phosphoshikimate 1-carboxyvinyltransferase